jgi:hypothetical protein
LAPTVARILMFRVQTVGPFQLRRDGRLALILSGTNLQGDKLVDFARLESLGCH